MPPLQFDLPRRLIAGLYARIVRRELGVPTLEKITRSSFIRSLMVAFGESFAAEHFVRDEFGLALHQRISTYTIPSVIGFPSFSEVRDHADALVLAAIDFQEHAWRQIDISNAEIEQAAISDFERLRDYQRIRRMGGETVTDWSPNGPLGSLWPIEEPNWWRAWREYDPADRWVDPMSRLGRPIWSSKELSPSNVVFLVNFGLDRIEASPQVIEPWTRSASELVSLASRPGADIRKLVDCCKVDP